MGNFQRTQLIVQPGLSATLVVSAVQQEELATGVLSTTNSAQNPYYAMNATKSAASENANKIGIAQAPIPSAPGMENARWKPLDGSETAAKKIPNANTAYTAKTDFAGIPSAMRTTLVTMGSVSLENVRFREINLVHHAMSSMTASMVWSAMKRRLSAGIRNRCLRSMMRRGILGMLSTMSAMARNINAREIIVIVIMGYVQVQVEQQKQRDLCNFLCTLKNILNL